MTPFQRSIARDSAIVGVRVSFDREVRLPSRHTILARAHFPDFGGPRGTLIFHTFDEYRDVRTELASEGYAYSKVGDPSIDHGDPDSLREMLADWGWTCVETPAPSWLKRFEPDTEDE